MNAQQEARQLLTLTGSKNIDEAMLTVATWRQSHVELVAEQLRNSELRQQAEGARREAVLCDRLRYEHIEDLEARVLRLQGVER